MVPKCERTSCLGKCKELPLEAIMDTGSVSYVRKHGRPSTSRTEGNVQVVQEMFTRSLHKNLAKVV
ncbi:hypothetical protein X975_09011, partial [Stegodyphus mimosarum]